MVYQLVVCVIEVLSCHVTFMRLTGGFGYKRGDATEAMNVANGNVVDGHCYMIVS